MAAAAAAAAEQNGIADEANCCSGSNTLVLTKRVSFGGQKGGQLSETFVYEKENYQRSMPANSTDVDKWRQGSSQLDETPSKVRVTTSTSELPNPIYPPTSIDAIDSILHGGSSPATLAVANPPLLTLQRMEKDAENPFRPDGELSHIVEPIVDAYKTKPYPEEEESADGQQEEEQPMLSHRQVELQMTADGTAAVTRPAAVQQTQTQQPAPQQQPAGGMPKVGTVELVHLEEKKRRCGCCVVQ